MPLSKQHLGIKIVNISSLVLDLKIINLIQTKSLDPILPTKKDIKHYLIIITINFINKQSGQHPNSRIKNIA
jgi:hypothetical protein